ncbi:hypothetical protein, partial [Shewanella sp. SG41-4]|uniref:hypothetical protein n=1 Tax=Shewanella sp. SG41-4 TaxID=2760976 RepID=UPI001C71B816
HPCRFMALPLVVRKTTSITVQALLGPQTLLSDNVIFIKVFKLSPLTVLLSSLVALNPKTVLARMFDRVNNSPPSRLIAQQQTF